MKILYLASVRIPSEKASGLAIVRQCQAFSGIGHDVQLVFPVRKSGVQDSIEEAYGIKPNFKINKITSFSLFSLGKPGYYFMLGVESIQMFFYYFRHSVCDLIYARDQTLLLLLVLAGKADKCFLELHTKHTDFVTKFVVKRVKKVIVISKGLEEYYKKMTGRNDIQIEPSGVDLDQFKNLPDKNVLKDKFQLPADKVIYGYVGKYKTMGEGKGVKEIIEAFSVAYKEIKGIHLLIVGVEETERDEVSGITDNCYLPSSAYTILSLDQKIFAEYLMSCDVLLMNYPDTEHYREYMSPTKLFAYLASGKPIISSDLYSVRGIADEVMLFTPANNIASYADMIIYALTNLDSLKKLKDRRIELANKYSWKVRASLILNNYHE